ncbi:MAG: hypothetical protein L0Z51_08945 [Candidatus Latescibacteria bacterium]|nr:hypothetical protein [Candidatus Latescibacterota bacterium]
MSSEFWEAVERIRSSDGRYARDAYAFVMDSLDYTMRVVGERRHVSAAELVRGLCDNAKQRFGLFAYTVFARWGLLSSGDVGEIVFQLIDGGILSRQESDTRADFDDVVDFREALEASSLEAEE